MSRKAQRLQVNLTLTLTLDGDPITLAATTTNISSAGCLVRLNRELPIGRIIHVALLDDETGNLIDMDGVIEIQEILGRYERLAARYACVVVEGAGGLLVPMGKDWDMRDLIGRIGLPVVLVGRAGLGGINHALLTLEGLRQRHCAVMAVVMNETALSTTPAQQEQCASTVALLRERAGVPVLGPLSYQPHLGSDWSGAVEMMAQSSPIRELADLVWAHTVGMSGSPRRGPEP